MPIAGLEIRKRQMASLDQESLDGLPVGARGHLHLRPNFELSGSLGQLIIGRLDCKGTRAFYDRFFPKKD